MQLDFNFDDRPVPNENGVCSDDDAFVIEMPRTKSGAAARVAVIEVAPGEWVHAASYMLNTRGSASPLTAHPRDTRLETLEQAVAYGLAQIDDFMSRSDQDYGSTAPSKTQIKQVRNWINSQRTIYARPLRAAA